MSDVTEWTTEYLLAECREQMQDSCDRGFVVDELGKRIAELEAALLNHTVITSRHTVNPVWESGRDRDEELRTYLVEGLASVIMSSSDFPLKCHTEDGRTWAEIELWILRQEAISNE